MEEMVTLSNTLEEEKGKRIREEEKRQREEERTLQLSEANACHARTEMQLREDNEELKKMLACESEAGERWTRLIQESNESKFEAMRVADGVKRELESVREENRVVSEKKNREMMRVEREMEEEREKRRKCVEERKVMEEERKKVEIVLGEERKERESLVLVMRRKKEEVEEKEREIVLLEKKLTRAKEKEEVNAKKLENCQREMVVREEEVEEKEKERERMLMRKEKVRQMEDVRKMEEVRKVEVESDKVEEAMVLIKSLETEMEKRRGELEETKNIVEKMKRAVSIADTAAAAMARGREEAFSKVEILRSELSILMEEKKSLVMELESSRNQMAEAEAEAATHRMVRKKVLVAVASVQTEELLLKEVVVEEETAVVASSFVMLGSVSIAPVVEEVVEDEVVVKSSVDNDRSKEQREIICLLENKLEERDDIIIKQSEWRKKHMSSEMEMVKDLHELRVARKVMMAAHQTSLQRLTDELYNEREVVNVQKMEMMNHVTSTGVTHLPGHDSKKIFVETSETGVQTEEEEEEEEEEMEALSFSVQCSLVDICTLVSIPGTKRKSVESQTNGTELERREQQEESRVLHHALKKLQEELSQVRIDYDTQNGRNTTMPVMIRKMDTMTRSSPTRTGKRVVLGELN